jgi:hypothetical protein
MPVMSRSRRVAPTAESACGLLALLAATRPGVLRARSTRRRSDFLFGEGIERATFRALADPAWRVIAARLANVSGGNLSHEELQQTTFQFIIYASSATQESSISASSQG